MVKVRLYLPLDKLSTWPEQRDRIWDTAEKMQLKLNNVILKQLQDTKPTSKGKKVKPVYQRKSHKDIYSTYCRRNKVGDELTITGEELMEAE
jgi:hypothetical protein